MFTFSAKCERKSTDIGIVMFKAQMSLSLGQFNLASKFVSVLVEEHHEIQIFSQQFLCHANKFYLSMRKQSDNGERIEIIFLFQRLPKLLESKPKTSLAEA